MRTACVERLDAVAPLRAVEPVVAEWRGQPVRRRARMDVDAGVERLRRLEHRPEFLIVEIFVVRVRVDDESIELERLDRALHFFRGALGRLRRETGEAREALRMLFDHRGQLVVRQSGELRRGIRVKHLHAGRGKRQQVHVHSVLVHVPQALVFEIEQTRQQARLYVVRLRVVDPLHQNQILADAW